MITRRLIYLLLLAPFSGLIAASFTDQVADSKAVPDVPEGFTATLYAKDTLVRNPCSLAFDEQGRMFVGMGPQYRNPTPDTPRDSVMMIVDEDGDGVADHSKTFATGFNCVQALAWHGRDLWVANSPDLTIVRDLDGDGVADEYVKVFTDLGNIEHALHGLVWAPDGKLYMSKGNSKGVSIGDSAKETGRIAPKAFRELWAVKGPTEEAPPPVTYKAADYTNSYQDPRDDWGAMGGVLRCDDLGRNLEIISRGCRNPWDIGFDSGFNWLGTDNDQNEGDRIVMPFAGANFGWGHAWSAGWSGENEPHVAPMSGPVFQGSGTGIVFVRSPVFPKEYQGGWLINDWLLKTTYIYRPQWHGALITPQGGSYKPFITGKDTLFRPTDMEFGPDGALYVLGWGREYGGTFNKEGGQMNEGRIFRIMPVGVSPLKWKTAKRLLPLKQWTVDQLIEDLDALLPVARIHAADELVRRGEAAKPALINSVKRTDIGEALQTWAIWTLARVSINDASFNEWLVGQAKPGQPLNARIQALRIMGARKAVVSAEYLDDAEPRVRFEALQALRAANARALSDKVVARAAVETERVTSYALGLAFRDLISKQELVKLLGNKQAGVRCAALLALLDLDAITKDEVRRLADDKDPSVNLIAQLALGYKQGKTSKPANLFFETARKIVAESKRSYKLGMLRVGEPSYTDRTFAIKTVPGLLAGSTMIQTANADDRSSGNHFLTFDVSMDTIVYVAHDERVKQRPEWMAEFADTDMSIVTDDSKFHLWSKAFPPGKVRLGGNVAKGDKAKSVSQYFVVLQAKPLVPSGHITVMDEALGLAGDKDRGEGLFFAQAGCANCHRIGGRGTNFGPDLSNLRDRLDPRFIAQSILEPNAAITEGFAAHTVDENGKSYFGILLEEDSKVLTLGLVDGSRVKLDKQRITKHETLATSPMPPFAAILTPQHVADVIAFLRSQSSAALSPPTKAAAMNLKLHDGVLDLSMGEVILASYHTRSDLIKRPFFANIRSVSGRVMTRPFPVKEDPKNGGDHADMHPGLWLGFGDINGTDFWRNKGRIEHQKFINKPEVKDGIASFSALNGLMDGDGQELGKQSVSISMQAHAQGWRMRIETELWSDGRDLVLGAQEEMGLGIRLAPDLIEKAGGVVRNSLGDQSAKVAWGKVAAWWDYGKGGTGILAVPVAANQLPSWGHTRDYGVMVINPTPREPANQKTTIKRGSHLRLKYDVLVHDTQEHFDSKAAAATLSL